MKAPRFEYSRGVALASWPEERVELRFDLIRLDRRTGAVSAEMTALMSHNGSGPNLVHRARLNLSATRELVEVARHLERRQTGPDWSGLLEVASWQVIEARRRGRPAILLRDAVEPPAAGWAVEPVLDAMDPTVLFGDGGVAKSYLGLALAASIHSGRALAGLDVTRQLRCAYMDWEWREWPHLKRFRALWGPGELPDLLYVPCQAEGPLSHQVDRLRRYLVDHQVEYAVFDSVALACDGPPEEAEATLSFFQALARLEVGACLIAHVNKGGDTEKPFGSAFWHDSARATWFLKRVQEVDGLDLALIQKKINDGAPAAPIGLHFDFVASTGGRISAPRTTITRVDVRDVPDLAGLVPLKDRLARLLTAGGPLKVHELAEQLEAKADTVERTLRRYDGKLFERAEGPDRVVRWSNRTTVRTPGGQLSPGHLATEADTPGPPLKGVAGVRPTERPQQEELLKVSGGRRS